MKARGLPTVRTADHVGLTVPDLQQGIDFFVDVLGFDLIYTHAPKHTKGAAQQRQFNRHPDTEIVGIAMLTLGTLNLELFQFAAPDQRQEPPRISDWGGTHLALYVDDMEAALEHLREKEVQILGSPMPLPGPEAGDGNMFVFALGPPGVTIELISYSGGKAYEADATVRTFDPRTQNLKNPAG